MLLSDYKKLVLDEINKEWPGIKNVTKDFFEKKR